MDRISLTELEAIVAVAREGSFRKAALALGMSTTSLSNAVAKLESRLGSRLFNRTTRSVSLTDAGRTFVLQVEPSLRDIKDAMAGVRSQQQTPSGTLRINTFAAGARQIMSPLVLEFLRRYPDVHVDLVTEGRIVDIVADGFDLGLRRADLVPADMIAVPLKRRSISNSTESRSRRRTSTGTNASACACRTARSFRGISKGRGRPSRSM